MRKRRPVRPLPNDSREGLTERFLIVGDEGAQLANDEHGLERGDERLDHRGLEQSRRLPLNKVTSPTVGVDRIWLVRAITMRSGRSRLYRSELTTTAGRLFIAVWSVKGKGTTITSPKRSAIGTQSIRS